MLDTSIPFGSVDMTTAALVAKQKGCNAFYAGLDDNSNFALATALKQDGVKPKVVVFPTGYEPSVVGSPAWTACRAATSTPTFRPFQLPDAGTQQMKSALEKYEHFTSSEFPNFSQYESWLGADLMIKGTGAGRQEPDPCRRHHGAAQPQELQRQRAAARSPSITRPTSATTCGIVRVVHDRREERVRPGLEPAGLRHGPARHDDRLGVTPEPCAGSLHGFVVGRRR